MAWVVVPELHCLSWGIPPHGVESWTEGSKPGREQQIVDKSIYIYWIMLAYIGLYRLILASPNIDKFYQIDWWSEGSFSQSSCNFGGTRFSDKAMCRDNSQSIRQSAETRPLYGSWDWCLLVVWSEHVTFQWPWIYGTLWIQVPSQEVLGVWFRG